MRKLSSAVLLMLAYGGSISAEPQGHRQHGIHEHGVGQLHVAQEGTEVHVELESPAANIIGFEHAPTTAADHEALENAVATLKDGERLFRLSVGASCDLVHAQVETPLLDHDREPDHGHSDEEHDRNGHTDERGHDDGDDHDDDHERHESHADIVAEYLFACAHPKKLEQLAVDLFQAFPETERLLVQFTTAKGQGSTEITASNPVLTFR